MTQAEQAAPDDGGIAPYLRVRTVSAPVWLADGALAYLDDSSGVPQIWRLAAAGAAPIQVTSYWERIGALAASQDGHCLVFGMDSGGNERQQLWSLDLAHGKPRALTAKPDVIHGFGAFSPDGQRFAFAANSRDRRFFDVWAVDLNAPALPRLLWQADEHLAPLTYSPDGRQLLIHRANTNLDGDLLLMPANGGKPRVLLPHTGEASIAGAAFAPDGQAIYLATNLESDFASLRRLDLASGELTVLAAPDWDVEALAVPRQGDWLAYAINDDGCSRLVLRHLAKGDERPIRGLPEGVVTDLTWSPDGIRLAFAHSGAVDPPEIWTCDLDGSAQQMTEAALRGLERGSFVAPEIIRYGTFDGREIPAFWFRPPGDGPYPVVVDVHGGPESQRRPQFAPVTQYLLSRGFGVLAPNVRGSIGYGKTYCHLDDVERRMDSVADLAAAVDWLRARADVASDRTAVMGQSYGGFMTLAALTTYPERWAAGVDVVGIANFVTFLEKTGPWRRRLRAAEYGDVGRDGALLHDISPLHKADRIMAPLLIIHGRNDPRVPLGEAQQMADALRALGRDVELLIFDDEGHGLVKMANRIAGYAAVARFLARTLAVPAR